jgi:hypothetical protein
MGIEPGTSWLVVRRSDHLTTRLVRLVKVQFDILVYIPFTLHFYVTYSRCNDYATAWTGALWYDSW